MQNENLTNGADKAPDDDPDSERASTVSRTTGESQPVYDVLADHQRNETWYGREIVAELQTWADRFIVEFKLDIPEVVLCVEALPRNRYAQFRYGHNKFGLRGEIAFNVRYLDGRRPWWEVLATLLHELVHGWQQAHGSPGKGNYHNAEFRAKAQHFGLIVDRRGATHYEGHSRFKELVLRMGVDVPMGNVEPNAEYARCDSKQKKWSCACVNIRAAVEVNLVCLDCGSRLERNDIPGRPRSRRRARRRLR